MLKVSRFSILVLSLYASAAMAQESYEYVANSQFSSKGGVEVPNHLKRAFLIDAARLSLRTQEEWSNQSVELPQNQIQFYHNLLLTVYQQDELARRISNCDIHTTSNLSVDYLELIYDRAASWAEPLRSGVNATNSPILNKLMEQHDLIIDSYQEINSQQSRLILRAVEPINMAALANKLYEIQEVKEVRLDSAKSATTDIKVQPSGDSWQVVYLIKFKEGRTIKQHSWIFKVYRNGTVDFVTEAGAPIPDSMNCY
ncbi:MAG: hypothetical protein AAFP82_13515 [Bacteroidota bacterium]